MRIIPISIQIKLGTLFAHLTHGPQYEYQNLAWPMHNTTLGSLHYSNAIVKYFIISMKKPRYHALAQ
jgi:hypothetical protein